MPPPIQLVSLVASGGTPVQLVDQTGAPFPTTGTGPLVFANGPTLVNPILDNATLINTNITFDRIDLGAGTLQSPAITLGAPQTGFYSEGEGNVSVAIFDGGGPVQIASFDPAGLTIAGYVFTTTPPTLDDSTKGATTAWVNDAIAAIPVDGVQQLNAGTGITLTPSPITTTGSIAVDFSVVAPLASPAFTGNPTAPTPTAGDNDTSIATTAFVVTALLPYAPLASPVFTGDPRAPTPDGGQRHEHCDDRLREGAGLPRPHRPHALCAAGVPGVHG
jgi:hypothetical protein